MSGEMLGWAAALMVAMVLVKMLVLRAQGQQIMLRRPSKKKALGKRFLNWTWKQIRKIFHVRRHRQPKTPKNVDVLAIVQLVGQVMSRSKGASLIGPVEINGKKAYILADFGSQEKESWIITSEGTIIHQTDSLLTVKGGGENQKKAAVPQAQFNGHKSTRPDGLSQNEWDKLLERRRANGNENTGTPSKKEWEWIKSQRKETLAVKQQTLDGSWDEPDYDTENHS